MATEVTFGHCGSRHLHLGTPAATAATAVWPSEAALAEVGVRLSVGLALGLVLVLGQGLGLAV